jgi:Tfp pilus assembly protein PilO
MRPRGEIWRRRPWLWVPALVFFLANAAAFSVYKLGYAGQVEKLDVDIHAQEQRRHELNGQYQQLQTMIARVRTNQEQVQQLYADRFSTRSRRLTTITQEVKDLARQAGLSPRSISYPEKEIKDYGLIKRSFIFSVQGPYSALRKLVSLLETSHSYIVIDDLNVGSNTEGPELRIDLTLSTLFAMTAEDGAAAVPGASEASEASGTPETSAARGRPAGRPATTPRPAGAGGDS